MSQIHFLISAFLLTRILSAEIASNPEIDANAEESYSSDSFYGNVKLPPDQDMYFPDPDGGKMTQNEKAATWKGKKGNFDITVSIDNKDPYDDFRTEWRKNESKDNSKKKKKD